MPLALGLRELMDLTLGFSPLATPAAPRLPLSGSPCWKTSTAIWARPRRLRAPIRRRTTNTGTGKGESSLSPPPRRFALGDVSMARSMDLVE